MHDAQAAQRSHIASTDIDSVRSPLYRSCSSPRRRGLPLGRLPVLHPRSWHALQPSSAPGHTCTHQSTSLPTAALARPTAQNKGVCNVRQSAGAPRRAAMRGGRDGSSIRPDRVSARASMAGGGGDGRSARRGALSLRALPRGGRRWRRHSQSTSATSLRAPAATKCCAAGGCATPSSSKPPAPAACRLASLSLQSSATSRAPAAVAAAAQTSGSPVSLPRPQPARSRRHGCRESWQRPATGAAAA